jgi:hemerythrin-like domain-containing protein
MTMHSTLNQVELANRGPSLRAVMGDDHERLERLFDAVVTEAARGDAADLLDEWRTFEHSLLAHLEAEELHLLRAFGQSAPTEAEALLDEHARIREQLIELGIDLELHCLSADRVKAFIDGLRAHAAREEQLLYPWAARQLGGPARKQLHQALAVTRKK